jgi:arsenite methyltransferase
MAEIHEEVRAHYAEEALRVLNATSASASASAGASVGASTAADESTSGNACCGDGCGCGAGASERLGIAGDGAMFYPEMDRADLPEAAVLASLGCGNPIAVAELREGERVLDLGSGGGIDVLLSARRVGPTGRAFGLDMTDEMLALAQRNAAEAGATNVEWLKGHIEAIPLPAGSMDVVISNCVVNLAADKGAVFAEIARVLKPGGRIGIADVVADDRLSAEDRAALGDYAGCVAGALSMSEYRAGLEAAGLTDISISWVAQNANGIHSAIVKAVKPAANGTATTGTAPGAAAPTTAAKAEALPGQTRSCCGG